MFNLEATLLFNSNFTETEIEKKTYAECEVYCEFFVNSQIEKTKEMFKLFAFYNLETNILSNCGKSNKIHNYIKKLFSEDVVEENDIEDQFKGQDFG